MAAKSKQEMDFERYQPSEKRITQIEQIKADVVNQLALNGTLGEHFQDRVEDYIRYVHVKDELQDDIERRGSKVEKWDSRGQVQIVNNDSIDMLNKVNREMANILKELKVEANDPAPAPGDDEDL